MKKVCYGIGLLAAAGMFLFGCAGSGGDRAEGADRKSVV